MSGRGGKGLDSGYRNGLKTEVAIVGAGAAGLYSAYRLVADPATKVGRLKGGEVQIFEMSERIGGRLWSVTLPGMTISAELGGMRYMTSQEIATSLIEKVFAKELKPIPFPMGDDDSLDVYLRKQRLKAGSWTKLQKAGGKLTTNYRLNDDDVGFDADQLFNKLVYDTLTADPWFVKNFGGKVKKTGRYDYSFELDSRDWDKIKPQLTYNLPGPYWGQKVNAIGFWNLIKDQTSQEGYEFLADAGGYYSNTINWNAAEAFPYMVGDFSRAGTDYKTIAGGYEGILKSLAAHYLDQAGAGIWTENRLLVFKRSGQEGYRYKLQFMNQREGKTWVAYANRIILAMPRRSLELLDPACLDLLAEGAGDTFRRNLDSIIMEPSMKILMGFTEPWWRTIGLLSGHSITDLPMRQCYYFGVDPADSHSLLLGSYNDMDTVSFWQPLSAQPAKFVAQPTARVSAEELAPLAGVQASEVMVQEAINQLQELHGPAVTVPRPYVTWFRDWTEDPYGGGYHAWKAGYSVADVMAFMRLPNPSEAIHICGEAYSDQQGWIEGAFCVAERMLQDHLGLAWPTWLDKQYYLGW
ncbi:MAG: FAD-dependent oxidoreductase [Rhizobiales bacterium]|nr:FAD-dependent oxidoreductase [Hyphomicrobiales bacterium]MBI3672469.1 FAD-dependent oxidoreductase [Hyphomicrobiales bacterium]